MTENPTRICDVCGQFDSDPRHFVFAPNAPYAVPSLETINKVLRALPGDDSNVAKVRNLVEILQYSAALPDSIRVIYHAIEPTNDALPVNEYHQALVDLFDTDSILRHYDCCAAVGCPTDLCPNLLAAVGPAKGNELREKIQRSKKVAALGTGGND